MKITKRKLRNWAIGFVLALLLFLGLAYWAMTFAVNLILQEMGSALPVSQAIGQAGAPTEGNVSAEKKQPQIADKNGSDEKHHQYTAEVSEQRARNVQQDITLNEKLVISGIVMDSFTATELEWFTKLVSGGLSKVEKKKMRSVFLEKLSEEDYNRLIEIAEKYGLSQGRKYDDFKNK